MDDPEGSAGHSALWLALQNLTHGTGVQRDDLLEALDGELIELREYWRTNLALNGDAGRLSAVEVARRMIRANLDIHIRKLQPPKRVDGTKFINAILVCFNMQTAPSHAAFKDKDLSARRSWLADSAAARYRVSVSTSQRYLDYAITQFEQQILASGYTPAPRDSSPAAAIAVGEVTGAIVGAPVSSEAKTPFIPRPYLTEWLDEVSSTTQRVYVIGEAGTGKTRLVREYTAADNPVWIDAREDVTMLPGLIETLTGCGVDTVRYDTARIKHAFGELLTRANGPRLVVIDGILDPEQLGSFIPKAIHSRLIITSRKRPGSGVAVIDVADMKLGEAAEMAAALLPEFSEEDYLSLAAIFGCRPLLIEHSCRYIRETGTTDIPAYCTAVQRDIAAAIGAAAGKADSTDPTLTVIYGQYVKRLELESPRSIELLELLCFVAHLNVPPEYAMAYLLGVPMITLELLERAQMLYEDSVQPLVGYSLVSVNPGYGISMQPLTQRVLRGIFRDRMPFVVKQALPLLQNNDYHGLFDAGWHIFTVAGHFTCNKILTAHCREQVWSFLSTDLKEQLAPADTPQSLDGVGSSQWALIVTEVWKRMCDATTFVWWVEEVQRQRLGIPEAEQDALLPEDDPRDHLHSRGHRIQNEEVQAVRETIHHLQLRTFGGDAYEAWCHAGREVEAEAVFTFDLRSIMERVMRRYQDSPLGQLDLGLFFPNPEKQIEETLKHADSRGTIIAVRHDAPHKALDKRPATESNLPHRPRDQVLAHYVLPGEVATPLPAFPHCS